MSGSPVQRKLAPTTTPNEKQKRARRKSCRTPEAAKCGFIGQTELSETATLSHPDGTQTRQRTGNIEPALSAKGVLFAYTSPRLGVS